MPFKSEKQRRYLWAEHPEIAREWSKKYPVKQKLPLYSDKNKKQAELVSNWGFSSKRLLTGDFFKNVKKIDKNWLSSDGDQGKTISFYPSVSGSPVKPHPNNLKVLSEILAN